MDKMSLWLLESVSGRKINSIHDLLSNRWFYDFLNNVLLHYNKFKKLDVEKIILWINKIYVLYQIYKDLNNKYCNYVESHFALGYTSTQIDESFNINHFVQRKELLKQINKNKKIIDKIKKLFQDDDFYKNFNYYLIDFSLWWSSESQKTKTSMKIVELFWWWTTESFDKIDLFFEDILSIIEKLEKFKSSEWKFWI